MNFVLRQWIIDFTFCPNLLLVLNCSREPEAQKFLAPYFGLQMLHKRGREKRVRIVKSGYKFQVNRFLMHRKRWARFYNNSLPVTNHISVRSIFTELLAAGSPVRYLFLIVMCCKHFRDIKSSTVGRAPRNSQTPLTLQFFGP